MQEDIPYGIRLFALYGILWCIDVLDATVLHIALPRIAQDFNIPIVDADWALIGFLLATVIGMILCNPISSHFGMRRVFLCAQWVYIFSSLACGIAFGLYDLVFYRVIQGFAGGLILPLGMLLTMLVLPHRMWASVGSWTSFFTFLTPAIGPIHSGYITQYFNWRWLFLIKLPILLVVVFLSHHWVKKTPLERKTGKFNWHEFIFSSLSLILFLLALTEFNNPKIPNIFILCMIALSLVFSALFLWHARKAAHPLIPLKIFRNRLFAGGNLIQSAANVIFLGSTFLVSIYLQKGLNFSIALTGWMIGSISLGMMSVMPLSAKFYNRIGPLPFIIPGLLLLSMSMFSFIFITPQTSPWLIAMIIFFEGAGASAVKTCNFIAIFSEIPQKLKSSGSAIYSIFKQISASLGIALSTLSLSIGMTFYGVSPSAAHILQESFYIAFILLGLIPLLGLPCCLFINNKKAISHHASHEHLETEFEEGAE